MEGLHLQETEILCYCCNTRLQPPFEQSADASRHFPVLS